MRTGQEPWEVHVIKGEADQLSKAADSSCCGGEPDATTGAGNEPVAAPADCC